jgi:hypothetical protein
MMKNIWWLLSRNYFVWAVSVLLIAPLFVAALMVISLVSGISKGLVTIWDELKDDYHKYFDFEFSLSRDVFEDKKRRFRKRDES